MRRILSHIARSFYDMSFYREVYAGWSGVGVRHVMLIVALVMLPITAINGYIIHSILSPGSYKPEENLSLAAAIMMQLPEMTYQAGAISTEQDAPIIISHPEKDIPLLTIDTRPSAQSEPSSTSPALLSARNLQLQAGGRLETISLSELASSLGRDPGASYTITAADLLPTLQQLQSNIPLIFIGIYTALWLNSTLETLTQCAILSLLTMVLCKIMKVNMRYADQLRLTTVAATPVVILHALELGLSISPFSNPSLIHAALHTAYLVVAIESCRHLQRR